MSSDSPRTQQQLCHICNKFFTPRSLTEHLQNTHLGTICYFPGSNFSLSKEDDPAMTEALLRANAQLGGGEDPVQDEKPRHWCYWPDCRGVGERRHSYDSAESLRRHLRTKQRDMFKKMSPGAAQRPNRVRPELFQAWSLVNHWKLIRDVRFDCLTVLLNPRHSPEEVGSKSRLFIFDYVQEANTGLDQAVQNVWHLTNNPDTQGNWNNFIARDQWRRENFPVWALNCNFTTTPTLSWDVFHHQHAFLSEILNQLEHQTTVQPNLQPAP
ncbi:hypothetical protein F5Y06DRAFT_307557 [Hypoxylon sp. FL0890]|nr:hypothetical protein F5Y06DRAFT_307557 [Hypoxylon sp. FL0890]